MFNNITWTQYIAVLAIILLVYYTAVLAFYYRKELSTILSRRSHGVDRTPTSNPNENPVNSTNDPAQLIAAAGELEKDINGLLHQFNRKVTGKTELLSSLKIILRKYSHLKATAFQVAINNRIVSESLTQFNLFLDEADLQSLW